MAEARLRLRCHQSAGMALYLAVCHSSGRYCLLCICRPAVADGGAYSVDSVATRIMDMATSIAGGDPDKLKAMQDAVEEGFRQAGITWKDAMGEDDMPQITKDTHAEINKRFEELFNKLNNPEQE